MHNLFFSKKVKALVLKTNIEAKSMVKTMFWYCAFISISVKVMQQSHCFGRDILREIKTDGLMQHMLQQKANCFG
jgi:hypothetical protein